MRRLLRWGMPLMSLTALACGAEPLPMLEPAARSFSFAVLGDLHFSRPAFEREQTLRAIAAFARRFRTCRCGIHGQEVPPRVEIVESNMA